MTTLSPLAYTLPLLHAAAHPSDTVTGLLLGASPSNITEALPLVHTYASLSPASELGLDLAMAYAKDRNLVLAGVYVAHAEESAAAGGGVGLGRVGEALLKSVESVSPGAVGIVLDNSKLDGDEAIYVSYPTTANISYPPALVRAAALALVRKDHIHAGFKDLDDHLEDSTADWTNEALKKSVGGKLGA